MLSREELQVLAIYKNMTDIDREMYILYGTVRVQESPRNKTRLTLVASGAGRGRNGSLPSDGPNHAQNLRSTIAVCSKK